MHNAALPLTNKGLDVFEYMDAGAVAHFYARSGI